MHASRANGVPPLRLIHGDMDEVVYIGRVAIQLAPQERPPFAVSAVAVEQDTALLLDDESEFRLPHQSLSQLGEEMARFSAPQPGSTSSSTTASLIRQTSPPTSQSCGQAMSLSPFRPATRARSRIVYT